MKSKKSMAVAVILTLLFGPLGMLYATIKGGLIMIGANIVVAIITVLTGGIGSFLYLITWIIQLVWVVKEVNKINAEADAFNAQMVAGSQRTETITAKPVAEEVVAPEPTVAETPIVEQEDAITDAEDIIEPEKSEE